MVMVKYPIWNGLTNSIPILNENHPIHLIYLSIKKDPFTLISHSKHPGKKQQSVHSRLMGLTRGGGRGDVRHLPRI